MHNIEKRIESSESEPEDTNASQSIPQQSNTFQFAFKKVSFGP